MNFNHLNLFGAVAQTGSVTRAAEKLLVSQPAISKQVKLLERALHVTLFERGRRSMRLTESGEVLADYARRIFSLAEEAEQAMEDLQHLRRGKLAVGASTTVGVYLLPDVFVQFRRKFPGIRMHLEIENGIVLRKHLEEGQLDLGLTEAEIDSPLLESNVFMHDELVAIAQPVHHLARRRSVSAEEFCREPFIVRETGSGMQSLVERSLADRGIKITPSVSLGSTEAIKRAVAGGLGVAMVPRLTIGLEVAAGRLAKVHLKDLSIRRPLYQYRPSGRRETKAVQAFLCLVKHAARGTLPRLPSDTAERTPSRRKETSRSR